MIALNYKYCTMQGGMIRLSYYDQNESINAWTGTRQRVRDCKCNSDNFQKVTSNKQTNTESESSEKLIISNQY